jgi:quercetin dioxygenase-like cupin family protein
MSSRVARDEGAIGSQEVVPPVDSSPLRLSVARLAPGEERPLTYEDGDALLFAFEGDGRVTIEGGHDIGAGTAALALQGEPVTLIAGARGLAVVCVAVGENCDLHAPMGRREVVVRREQVDEGAATGSRSFQVLFGPHNGSTRATLFIGAIPPGKAPWHYHLYDEIVWVLSGTGRVHLAEAEDLVPGSAFRLSPREVHIVENTSSEEELLVLGIFTPAGSPSAAYLEPGVAAEYRIG